MPSAHFELVRYTGHLPQLERPESVQRHIEAFLNEKRRSWRGEQE
jgi:pimeloyl-ACP methyl ester carboxylesterase